MPASPTRHRVALAIALLGVVVSGYTLYVEHQLSTTPGWTSFVCNLGGVASCDSVLTSRWGTLLEVPLPVWAIVAFAAGAVLAVPGAVLGIAGGLADWLLLGLVASSLGFALVMAAIAAFVLGAVCPLCITLYVVIAAWFVTVAPLAGGFARASSAWLRRPAASRGAIIGGLALALIGGTLWARAPEATGVDPEFAEYYRSLPAVAGPEIAEGGHAKGQAEAPVTIVEFSDFQCPACRQAYLDLSDLARSRSDVRIVFRPFPLVAQCNERGKHGIPRDACLAACAAECAADQGRFWDYHDRLFDNQSTLDRDNLFRFARELSLDIAAFRACLDAPETLERVRRDVARAGTYDVKSTPTLFINGRRVEGALDRPYYDYAITIERQKPPTSG
jgi:protein-disulfide isomerase/uncharacterized membrane protein